MEHYENKQIFINDKYKGSGAQKDVPCTHTHVCPASVCVRVCGVFPKSFNLNDVAGQLREWKSHWGGESEGKGTAIGPCKLSQQPGAGAGAMGKSLIVDIIFLTALHLFLARHLSTLARIDFHFIAK